MQGVSNTEEASQDLCGLSGCLSAIVLAFREFIAIHQHLDDGHGHFDDDGVDVDDDADEQYAGCVNGDVDDGAAYADDNDDDGDDDAGADDDVGAGYDDDDDYVLD